MKLLVTEFLSKLQEQATNKAVEATVDTKYAVKSAQGISSLHNTKV